jgi:DNA-binding transcriptional ArsR family regulator
MKQHSTDRQGFGVLPAHIHRDPNVTPLEKCILLDLSQYAGANGDAWPRVALLAEHQGVSRPTIYRALASLEKRGLVERHARRRSDGSRSSNLYQLRFSAWGKREVFSPVIQGGLTGDTGGSAGDTGPVSPVVHHEEEQEKNHLLSIRETLQLTDEHRERWSNALHDSGMSAAKRDAWFLPLELIGVSLPSVGSAVATGFSGGTWWLRAADRDTARLVNGPEMSEVRELVCDQLGADGLAVTCP